MTRLHCRGQSCGVQDRDDRLFLFQGPTVIRESSVFLAAFLKDGLSHRRRSLCSLTATTLRHTVSSHDLRTKGILRPFFEKLS